MTSNAVWLVLTPFHPQTNEPSCTEETYPSYTLAHFWIQNGCQTCHFLGRAEYCVNILFGGPLSKMPVGHLGLWLLAARPCGM